MAWSKSTTVLSQDLCQGFVSLKVDSTRKWISSQIDKETLSLRLRCKHTHLPRKEEELTSSAVGWPRLAERIILVTRTRDKRRKSEQFQQAEDYLACPELWMILSFSLEECIGIK
jgi:hypothetical protein